MTSDAAQLHMEPVGCVCTKEIHADPQLIVDLSFCSFKGPQMPRGSLVSIRISITNRGSSQMTYNQSTGLPCRAVRNVSLAMQVGLVVCASAVVSACRHVFAYLDKECPYCPDHSSVGPDVVLPVGVSRQGPRGVYSTWVV